MKNLSNSIVPLLIIIALILMAIIVIGKKRYEGLLTEFQQLTREHKTIQELYEMKGEALTTCTRSLIGEKSGMIALFESVDEDVQSLEMIVHTDTESGEPRKFVLSCGDKVK